MATTVDYIALYKNSWGEGKLIKPLDIIGLDITNINIEVQISTGDQPASVEVEIRTREPGNKTGGKTSLKSPVRITVPRSGQSKWYLASVPLSKIQNLMSDGDALEFATVCRWNESSWQVQSDAAFRKPLQAKGWANRGTGIQEGSTHPDFGDPVKERPNARCLFRAGGVEILEVKVVPSYGMQVNNGTDWAFIRSSADVMFYSGHGWKWDGQLVLHPGHEEWLTPQDLLKDWRMRNNAMAPCDLDLLVINGCSVLYWDVHGTACDPDPKAKDRPNIAHLWGEHLCKNQGPLWALCGYRLKAPLDEQGGNTVAAEFGAALAGGLQPDTYARKWMEINASHSITRANAAALDRNGYWMFDTQQGKIVGPIPFYSA